jgi:tRNA modification GTPase
MHSLDDTIAAIASPPGGAARGIVRLSGPGLRDCLERCFRPDPYVHLPSLASPTAVPGLLWLSGFAAPVACDLYLWPLKRSYTGQSMAEIHTLGSMPILEAVLRAVLAGGARLAEPGEFTLRAFLSGRIDLTQAEAVLGVIEAELPEELDAALAQMAGGLAAPLGQLRDALLELLSHVEAGLDFADEDLAFISPEQLAGQLDAAAAQVARLSERIVLRGDAVELVRVVLVGLPNTGKSSLFNALARGAEALVSHEPGTTRDYLTAELDLDGVKCQLIDTAGIHEEIMGGIRTCGAGVSPALAAGTAAPQEDLAAAVPGSSEPGPAAAAQAVALQQARRAHVQVLCIDASQGLPSPSGRGAGGEGESASRRIVVLTKADLLATPSSADRGRLAANTTEQLPQAIETSSVTGQGLGQLRKRLREAVLHAIGPRGDVVAGTAVRSGESVRRAAECLDRARQIARTGRDEEFLAAELRTALDELGKVAGAVYSEDLLDRIFSRFCIGK